MNEAAAPSMPLAAGFPPADHAEWQRLAAGVVNKTRAEDRRLDPEAAEAALRTTLPGGLVVDPLYLRPEDAEALGLPGEAPFTRGRVLRDAGASWDVRQLHDDPDAALSAQLVLDDLERGVTSVWVHVGPDGVAVQDLPTVLAGVRLEMAPVVVSSWTDQAAAADALRGLLAGVEGASGNLGLDPIGAAARTGAAADLDGLAEGIRSLGGLPGVRAITVDARVFGEAGATAQEEVGFAAATGLAYLRRLEADGVDVATAFGHIDLRVSASADQFLTTAALRALRRVWARVGEACGVAGVGTRVHAVTSVRMFTRDDPWVNVLRSTLATFGAAVGGADAITVLPYDTVHGLPERFSRRLARNTQVVLAEESHVAAVTDPGGGGWYLESLTDDVARAAWAVLQEVEAAGGMERALADGLVGRRLDAARAEAAAALASRRQPITGVSMFPATDEKPLERRARPSLPTVEGALVPHRDAEAFEALRDRAAAAGHPTVRLLTLGTARDFGPREAFVRNLLAAGGIGTGDDGEVAVLASSPKGYAANADVAIRDARAAGVTHLLVAGRASELGDHADEVDGEVRDGMDVVALLDDLLTRLGAPAEGARS
jgi:methylmalonyl-CoA mutase